MDAFTWNTCFVTGLDEVDAQHKGLVDLINRFGDVISKDGGASDEEIEIVFSDLARYAVFHFAEEEAMMDAMQLHAGYISQHRQSHAKFLEEVNSLHPQADGGNATTAKSLLQFLTHWLAYHILGSDRFMARQIELIKTGVSAQEAYATQISTNDPATDTLLTALNGLFQQVSERNHDLQLLNRTLEARVAERTRELTEVNARLNELANTDVLTGLPNRRYALRFFAETWSDADMSSHPLSCMMIDADGFKGINDTFGHDAGDEVLRVLSRLLSRLVRTDDVVCRLGGDEFLIICVGTALQDALNLGEKLRSAVSELQVPVPGGHWKGSLSVGVAARRTGMSGIEDLMKAADEGVYLAKRNGRNCVATVQQASLGN